MIRCWTKLMKLDFSRHNKLCTLLNSGCSTQKHNSLLLWSRNQILANHLCSVQATVTEKKSTTLPQVSMTPQVVSILETLHDLGFEECDVLHLLKNQPELAKSMPVMWSNVAGTLLQSNFKTDHILSIIEKWPQVLFLKKSDFVKNLEAWFSCSFGFDLLFELITTHPYFLKVDHNLVSKRVKQYQLYFESKRNVAKLLVLAPNTLEENWNTLSGKLNYLDELCVGKQDIVSTGVLVHSEFHIKVRHEFLIRAGVFKRPQKDFIKRLSKNPTLNRIVNTSDEHFVSHVAKLSLFEYSVFLEMFKDEIQESDHDSDSDDETHRLSYKMFKPKNKSH